MPKRTKKDIESTSEDIVAAKPAPDGTAPPAKKRTTKKAAAKTAVVDPVLNEADDPELQSLLLQVDTMLTEMTQSKWLSSDWPSLEIDFGTKKE
jgi:hypothetical protein